MTPARLAPLFLFAGWALLAGCGGGSGGGETGRALTIAPGAVSLRTGATQAFTAAVDSGGGGVQWSVEGTNAGTIAADGTYTAPGVPGVFTVRARLKRSPDVTATATVTVSGAITVEARLPATNPVVIPRSRVPLTAVVANTPNPAVTWTVLGGQGSVAPDGTFTAPDRPGTFTVVARSKEDPSRTGSVAVTVVANANVRLKVDGKADIVLALRPDKAPNTCANFVSLVNAGFYDGILFHRYVADFVIQGGDPLTKTLPLDDPSIGTGDPGYKIPFEANDLLHDRHALAMARATGRDTAGSQFYVTLTPQPSLDGDYVVFGRVAQGGDVVDTLRRSDRIGTARTESVP